MIVTFEQRPNRSEGTRYKNIFKKGILGREKSVFSALRQDPGTLKK